ncbi:MAG: metal-sulfur cluster assembly factor [Patescibacteria group bacterium]
MLTKEQVWEKLKKVKDPEIGLDIVSLGLVYGVAVEGGQVKVTMTLTSPMCPLGDSLVSDVKASLKDFDGVSDTEVQMTFDPPWDTSRMSADAKAELGVA